MTGFDTSDIAEVAVRIEENGIRFYRHAAGLAVPGELRTLFCRLAEDEEQHARHFAALRADLAPLVPPEGYDEAYTAYLQRYVDDILVFRPADLARELARIGTASEALDFAIRRELDAIFYYQQIGLWLPPDRRKTIEAIAAEERRHFTELSAQRRQAA